MTNKKRRFLPSSVEFSALSFTTLCGAVKCYRSCMQMNGRKAAMQPETDVDSESSLTSFNVLSTTLAWQLLKLVCRDCLKLKLKIKMHYVAKIIRCGLLCIIHVWKGLFCVKMCVFSAYLQPLYKTIWLAILTVTLIITYSDFLAQNPVVRNHLIAPNPSDYKLMSPITWSCMQKDHIII